MNCTDIHGEGLLLTLDMAFSLPTGTFAALPALLSFRLGFDGSGVLASIFAGESNRKSYPDTLAEVRFPTVSGD
jgi:hypothetical protein